MFKLPIIFAGLVIVILLIVVYNAGDYHLNIDYITATVEGKPPVETTLISDSGTQEKNNYSLTISTKGVVEFQKNIGGNRDSRSFEIEGADIETIKQHMNSSGIFKLYTLDRTYCFSKYDGKMNFDFGWVNKGVKYSNCSEDPTEVKEFRHFLYNFLSLSLEGT